MLKSWHTVGSYQCSNFGPARARAGPRFGPGRAEILGWGVPKAAEFVVLTGKLPFLHEIHWNPPLFLFKNTLSIEFDRFYSQKVLFLPRAGQRRAEIPAMDSGPGRAEVRHRPGRAGPEFPIRTLVYSRISRKSGTYCRASEAS